MGPAEEGGTIQELRSLGRVLQAILLRVEQKLGTTHSSEEWMQVAFVIDRLLFIVYIIFITISFFTIIIFWVDSYYHTGGFA